MAIAHAFGSESFGLHKGNEKCRECIALAPVTCVADPMASHANCASGYEMCWDASGSNENGEARETDWGVQRSERNGA